MGTMWNTNLIIDRQGRILGKHRKLVPTFAEKMIWSRGDGSGIRVWETDIGKLGTLACGENSNTLARYALLAQGEQVHVANYPATGFSHIAQSVWIHLMASAHSCEGKVFTVVSTSTVSQEMIEMLCDTQEKRQFMMNASAYSGIYGPNGEILSSIQGEEGIIYADIDVEQEIVRKQFHDIIGHYNRFDVLSLNLNIDEDRPIRLFFSQSSITDSRFATSEGIGKLLQQSEASQRQLEKAIDLLSQLVSNESGEKRGPGEDLQDSCNRKSKTEGEGLGGSEHAC